MDLETKPLPFFQEVFIGGFGMTYSLGGIS
jgi:hypothetical protein